MSITGRWEIEVCGECGWQVDTCDECGCADDENQHDRVDLAVVPAEQLEGAVSALEQIATLGRTDGPPAPLLVQAGNLAEAALRTLRGQ